MIERRRLRKQIQRAAGAVDDHSSLSQLLALKAQHPAEPLVLTEIAKLYHRIGLPERARDCLVQAQQLGTAPDPELYRAIELDIESFYRNEARLALIRDEVDSAHRHIAEAAKVTEPTTWTIRVLVDTALAAGNPGLARPELQRARTLRPDDAKLVELEQRLDG